MIKIIVFCVLLAIISSICKANVVDNVSVRDFYEPRLNRKDDSKRLGNHAKRHFHIYQDTSISKKISSIEIVGAGPPAEDGSADIMSSVFNLSKTILGAGILSLPAAVAAFSDQVSLLDLIKWYLSCSVASYSEITELFLAGLVPAIGLCFTCCHGCNQCIFLQFYW